MRANSLERRVTALEQRQQAITMDPERVRKLAAEILRDNAMLRRPCGEAPLTMELALDQAKRLFAADPEWDRRPISPELQELLDQARRNKLESEG